MPALSLLLGALGALTAFFSGAWVQSLRRLRREGAGASDPAGAVAPPGLEILGIGGLTMFFDTLGIGAFATTTALLRFRRKVPDHLLPGTLNVGLTLPSVLQSFIYTRILPVEMATLVCVVAAATLGAWLGAGVVARWPKPRVQAAMGLALMAASLVMLLTLVNEVLGKGLLPAGGAALGVQGAALAVAILASFGLGALMTLGIGFYAPSMILLSFLGMSPKAIFPVMMTACAFLMPVGSLRFIRERCYSPRVAVGLTLGGLPTVLLAAFLVKEMPLAALRGVVVAVTMATGASLWRASVRSRSGPGRGPLPGDPASGAATMEP